MDVHPTKNVSIGMAPYPYEALGTLKYLATNLSSPKDCLFGEAKLVEKGQELDKV